MEEETQTASKGSVPKWALIAGVTVIFLCLAVLLTLFLGRNNLLSFAVSALASDTPIPTETLPPTMTNTPEPTATETSIPEPTQEPTATTPPMPPAVVSGLAQGDPAVRDSFGDNNNNWIGFMPSSEVIIQENQLQLRSSESGTPALALCQGDACGSLEDFYYYQADIVEDRPTTLALGLLFGINAQKSGYYTFAIRPSSAEFSLRKFAAGQSQALIDWSPSPAIKFYPFVNTVGVSYQEGNIGLFVNGTQVGSYTDKQPNKAGRVGFSIESDGLRMLASNATVLKLAAVTPEPPSGPVSNPPSNPPGGAPAGATQASSYASPTPVIKYTFTPTAAGSCPAYVSSGNFVVVVFKSSPGNDTIVIDGSRVKVAVGNNPFYLSLKQNHVLEIGKKTYEYNFEVCKIITLKMK